MQDIAFKADTLYEALTEVAGLQPDATAIVFDDASITYSELIKRVDVIAICLQNRGIQPGQSIAAFGQNSPDFVAYYYAAAKIGAVFVPLNFNLTTSEIAYILEHCEAQYLFVDKDAKALITQSPETASFIDKILPLEIPTIGESGNIRATLSVNKSDQDLIISYTSGSTGFPKAVVMDHKAQLGAARALKRFWGLHSGDCTVVAAPLGFLLGLSTATTVGLLAGMKVVLHRRFHPAEVLDSMVKHNVTIYNGVPTMYSMMLEYCEQQNKKYDLSGTRALICSGAPLAEELRNRFASLFKKNIQNYYGMTECYPLIGKYADDPKPLPEGCVGRLAPGAEILVVKANGAECAIGESGEILVKAASMLKRYHKDPNLTNSSLENGWFKSGDLGCVDVNGYVYLTGRLKDIIIRGGANISPTEVEDVLQRHTALQDAAVVGVPDKIYGEVPVAFVVLRSGQSISSEQLLDYCKQSLAKFKVPAEIIISESLPQGKTGKIDKAKLKTIWSERVTSAV